MKNTRSKVKAKPKKVVKISKKSKAIKKVLKASKKAVKKTIPKVRLVPKVPKDTKKKAVKKAPKKAIAKRSKPIKKVERAARPKKAPKEKKQAGYLGYTPDELKKYKELLVENLKLSNDKLKAILRANAQSMTGDKKTLIEKIADGEILGSMPRCSKCGGGYLKWDNKKGSVNED